MLGWQLGGLLPDGLQDLLRGLDTAAEGCVFFLFLGEGLDLGVVDRGLRRSPGLSPRESKEGVAGLGKGSFFTTFLGSALVQGERLLQLSDWVGLVHSLLSGVRVRCSSLSSRQSILSKEAFGGCNRLDPFSPNVNPGGIFEEKLTLFSKGFLGC